MKKKTFVYVLHQVVDGVNEKIGAYSTYEKAINQIFSLEIERENLPEGAVENDIDWDYWDLQEYILDKEF